MSNVIQIRDPQGNAVYPITDASLVIGLQDGPFSEYILSWDGSSTPVVANIPAGVSVVYGSTTYTGTLAASSSTACKVYLVASTSQVGEYDRYITSHTSSVYSWTSLASTQIQSPVVVDNLTTNDPTKALSAKQGKVLNEEVSQLGQIATAGSSEILKDYLTKRDGVYNATHHIWQELLINYGFYTYFGVAIPGASLTISTGAKGTIIYLLKSLPIDNQDVDFAGTESDSLIELQANATQTIVIPTAAVYYGIVENVLASGDYEFPQCSISKSGAEILAGKVESLTELTSIIPTLAQRFKNIGLSAFDINALQMGIISFVSTSVPSGLPNVDYSVGGLIITTRASETAWTNQDHQFLITESSLWERVYFNGFTQWFGGEVSRIKETTTTVPDIDNLRSGINSFVSLNVPTGFPNLDYTQGGLIITVRQSDSQLTNNDHQYIFTQNGVYTRAYYNGEWQAWFGTTFTQDAGRIVECGVGKEYTTLRSAIAAAIQTNGTKVIVYPGTYDLATEFATELENHSGSGILLTNDVHVIFMPGAYVTCMVDVSNEWAYTHFEPFRVNSGNFTLENANINCKNTRYNVHDELSGSNAQYIHRYINCIMEHYDENPIAYYTQCIGGGLGTNGYIEVIGGKYKSTSLYYQTEHYTSPDDMQMPITYHNGNNAACDCKIVIKDVYLVDKGYLRFGNYGPSTILTPVFVSGCRMYKPVFLMNETWSESQVQNFEVCSFNNEVVNP